MPVSKSSKISQYLLPFLQAIADGKKHHREEIIGLMSQALNLTEDEQHRRQQSGVREIANHFAWAGNHLAPAGLILKFPDSQFQITDEGQSLLQENLALIDLDFLKERYPAYADWVSDNQKKKEA